MFVNDRADPRFCHEDVPHDHSNSRLLKNQICSRHCLLIKQTRRLVNNRRILHTGFFHSQTSTELLHDQAIHMINP